MRLFVFALIAAALHGQEPNEARFPVAAGELEYLYSAGAGASPRNGEGHFSSSQCRMIEAKYVPEPLDTGPGLTP